MSKEIIVVEQLPVIVEKLQTIKADVTQRVNETMKLVCTEDTVQVVRKKRAELNKEFEEWEEKRKEVKKAIMTPYEQFETSYKECITDVFKNANSELKQKIDTVENKLKENKMVEVRAYFDEYCASRNIDFVTFENANINVTLSASLKSLKEQAKAFVDRVCDDLNLIDTQEYKDEILFLYKKADGFAFLNASRAIAMTIEKYKFIAEKKAAEEERKAKEQAVAAAVEKVDEVLAPPTVEEPTLTVKFTVRGTKTKLRELKEFLQNNNYDFEA